MYCTECVRLAERHPDLAGLIERVDAKFMEMGTAEVIRPDDLASFLAADPNQMRSVLDMLADEGVLVREGMIECVRCQMVALQSDYREGLDEDDEYRCTGCDHPLTDQTAQSITIYRRGEKWKGTPPRTAGLPEKTAAKIVSLDDQAWYTHDRLAEVFGVGKDALRKRLEKYRKNNLDGWKENEDRRPREPQYFYQLNRVKHIVMEMQASSERPAK